jgi:hypothetical protein
MRAVTFADLNLVEYLQQNFVLLWHNQSAELPGIAGVQQKYTPEQAKAYPEGGGGGNVRTYFCTADGAVAYYLEGYWGSERYLAEARFAQGLTAQLATLEPVRREEGTRKALAARRTEVAGLRQKLRVDNPEEFRKKVYQSELRKREAALGLLENTLTASAQLAVRPIEPIVRELALRNSIRGVIR